MLCYQCIWSKRVPDKRGENRLVCTLKNKQLDVNELDCKDGCTRRDEEIMKKIEIKGW